MTRSPLATGLLLSLMTACAAPQEGGSTPGTGGEMKPPPSATGGAAAPGTGGSVTGAGGTSKPVGTGGSVTGAGGTPGGAGGTAPATGGSGPPAGTGGTPGGSPDVAGPTPPSGVQIAIGGTMVPKEKAIVFIHIGHSDMLGRANGPAALKPFFFDTDPHLFVYRKGGTFAPAKEPTAGDTPSAGPGMALLKSGLAIAPDAYFISIGHGHSGADGGYCANFRKGKSLWDTFGPAAAELKGKVTFGGIFTMFGITEYRNEDGGLDGLADCLVGLAADIRTELGEPTIPLLVGDWNCCGTGIYSPTGANGMKVRPLIQMVPGRDNRSAIVSTDKLPMEDDRHLDLTGHKMWAERAVKILRDKSWAPWAP